MNKMIISCAIILLAALFVGCIGDSTDAKINASNTSTDNSSVIKSLQISICNNKQTLHTSNLTGDASMDAVSGLQNMVTRDVEFYNEISDTPFNEVDCNDVK